MKVIGFITELIYLLICVPLVLAAGVIISILNWLLLLHERYTKRRYK